MKKHILGFCLSAIAISGYSQTFNAGIRIQKTQEMYWENGVSAQYSFKNLKPNQLFFGFDYVTTRLGSAIGSNAMKQDNFIFSGSWAFRKDKAFHPVARLNMGYFYADYEEEIFSSLPNTAFLCAPEFVLNYEIPNLPLSVNLGTGYYVGFTSEANSPGTLQPLYYHLDVHYTIFKNKDHE